MKGLLVFNLLLTLVGFAARAQEAGRNRLGIDVGYALPKGGGGIFLCLEPKYNLTDYLNIGLRWQTAGMFKKRIESPSNVKIVGAFSFDTSFLGTLDYYFRSDNNNPFSLYVGGGLGLYLFANLEVVDRGQGGGLAADSKLGCVLRSGIEVSKIRMGLEYNLIPASTYLFPTGEKGVVPNNFLGISLGFFIGGGSYRKEAPSSLSR